MSIDANLSYRTSNADCCLRTIAAAAVAISALGYAGIIKLMLFVFVKDYVFTTRMVPQVWRIVTGFFITKRKIAILLDPYFCTLSHLESICSRLTSLSVPVR
jgi:hypothetical protein